MKEKRRGVGVSALLHGVPERYVTGLQMHPWGVKTWTSPEFLLLLLQESSDADAVGNWISMHACARKKHLTTDIYVCPSCIWFILSALLWENNNYNVHYHRAGICHQYYAQAFIPHKVWQIIDVVVRGQNTLVRSMSLPKKSPTLNPPPAFLSPAFIHYDAPVEKGAPKPAQPLPAYNFLMKSPNTFWQTYFLRKRKNLSRSQSFFCFLFLPYQPGK